MRWINFVHFGLGVIVLLVAIKGTIKLQTKIVAIPVILAPILGILGLLFGSYFANTYNI